MPFIARYRKERTGNLDEVAVRRALEAKELFEKILSRQRIIVESIERHATLSPELRERILSTSDLDELEDLYHPYRQQKKNRALVAREAGLEPLADWIWNCGHGTETPQEGQTLELWAFTFRNDGEGRPRREVRDRGRARHPGRAPRGDAGASRARAPGVLRRTASCAPRSRRRRSPTASSRRTSPSRRSCRPCGSRRAPTATSRSGAARRRTSSRSGSAGRPTTRSSRRVSWPRSSPRRARSATPREPRSCATRGRIAFKNNVRTSIENEVHRVLKEAADTAAAQVFAENVRRRLLEAPLGPRAVLGIDPGIRSGCKLAAVDATGRFVATDVVHLQADEQKAEARATVVRLAREHAPAAVAVGNGTGGREAEVFARAALREAGLDLPVVLVNEAGASVYSTSDAARAEFPDLDATVRGAISIARRLQDPLAELLKVEPRSIGVGQYQHDVAHAALQRALDAVVEDCVNGVGVDLNTASRHLLTHVAGLGPALAGAIVEHREKQGLFRSRQQLLEVARFGPKAFEQAAGFLRVRGGENPLDDTARPPRALRGPGGAAPPASARAWRTCSAPEPRSCARRWS